MSPLQGLRFFRGRLPRACPLGAGGTLGCYEAGPLALKQQGLTRFSKQLDFPHPVLMV
jgi:hypothetical protein